MEPLESFFYNNKILGRKMGVFVRKVSQQNYTHPDISSLSLSLSLSPRRTHSYHHNAYFMQQASVVLRQYDFSQFIKMMELVFQQQDGEF